MGDHSGFISFCQVYSTERALLKPLILAEGNGGFVDSFIAAEGYRLGKKRKQELYVKAALSVFNDLCVNNIDLKCFSDLFVGLKFEEYFRKYIEKASQRGVISYIDTVKIFVEFLRNEAADWGAGEVSQEEEDKIRELGLEFMRGLYNKLKESN